MMAEGPTWLSLLPPLVAIVLAMVTHRVIPSLIAGVLIGVWLTVDGQFLTTVPTAIREHLVPQLLDRDHLFVFAFTSLMGAMVGIVTRSGGMHALVGAMARWASNRRRGQLMTWLLGMIVFFDDYANALLVGSTVRPLADRLRISREKLAYLVDSTSAPVAGLALVSTWVAGEISYVAEGLEQVGTAVEGVSAFNVFLETIPYRFYPLWALMFVGFIAWTGRDWGPMATAESRADQKQPPMGVTTLRQSSVLEPTSDTPRHWFNAVAPITLCVLLAAAWLVISGKQQLADDGVQSASLIQIVGNGDSYEALLLGSVAGVALAAVLVALRRLMSLNAFLVSAGIGAWHMMPALAILWLAWTLSGLTGEDYLGTGVYLSNLIHGRMFIEWLPTVVFVMASLVAFATGTSWGTMGMLVPLVVELSYGELQSQGIENITHHPIFLACVGSVLAGAIMGDHCSPISDTTILSSRASQCDHVQHVRTQAPYALIVAAVAIVCGTVPIGLGLPVWPLLLFGPVVLWALLRVLGSKLDEGDHVPSL